MCANFSVLRFRLYVNRKATSTSLAITPHWSHSTTGSTGAGTAGAGGTSAACGRTGGALASSVPTKVAPADEVVLPGFVSCSDSKKSSVGRIYKTQRRIVSYFTSLNASYRNYLIYTLPEIESMRVLKSCTFDESPVLSTTLVDRYFLAAIALGMSIFHPVCFGNRTLKSTTKRLTLTC